MSGIIVVAVAHEIVIAHPGEILGLAQPLALVGGPTLYLLAHVAFRARVTGTLAVARLAAVGPIIGAAGLGLILPDRGHHRRDPRRDRCGRPPLTKFGGPRPPRARAASAGAMGRAATQIAHRRASRVNGADLEVSDDLDIDTSEQDLDEAVLPLTDGAGVNVTRDTFGGAVFSQV